MAVTRSASPHVVVVGAGPAGSSAAATLARLGARVTLLERARFPRDKVCGDGCTSAAVAALARLGLGDLPARDGAPISSLHVISPRGRHAHVRVAPPLEGRVVTLPRAVLDERLARNAAATGATLREEVTVRGLERDGRGLVVCCRGGERIAADVVLGCDGYPSIVRRALGAPAFPDRHSAVSVRAYHADVRLEAPDALTVVLADDPLAYGWIFPIAGGRANVGVIARCDRLRADLPVGALYHRFCEVPFVADQLARGRRLGRPRGHLLPLASFGGSPVYDHALLAGDAAGLISPFTGEGIDFALASGELAAQTVALAARRGDFSRRGLAPYARALRRRFGATLTAARLLQHAHALPGALDRVLRAAGRSAAVERELGDLLFASAPPGGRLVVAAALGI